MSRSVPWVCAIVAVALMSTADAELAGSSASVRWPNCRTGPASGKRKQQPDF